MSLSNQNTYVRAHVACKACNARKVRCTVTLSGPPCVNCTIDNIACEVRSRKRRRNTDLLPDISDMTPRAPESRHQDNITSSPRNASTPRPTVSADNASPQQEIVVATAQDEILQPNPGSDNVLPKSPRQLRQAQSAGLVRNTQEHDLIDVDSGQNDTLSSPGPVLGSSAEIGLDDTPVSSAITNDTSAWAEALGENGGHKDRVPFYPGDKRGPAYVFDICRPERSMDSNHIFVSMPSLESLQPEEIAYLRFRGCFSLPTQPMRELLLKAYFHYAHPFQPVLDPDDFFENYEKGHISLLLLWSVFSCAASFVDDEIFMRNSYVSKLAFKRTAYRRAKTLYDVDYENDKLTLIQSVFLMGHYYANAEDRMGPWHWNGIAISLSHTIGLHMLTSPAREGIKPLWRCIWWCIYGREVWLSLGQGRPMRISLNHSSTPMPESEDGCQLFSQGNEMHRHYVPRHLETLLDMWLSLVRLTRLVGKIISANYRIKGAEESKANLEQQEREIRTTWLTDKNCDQDPVLATHLYHFRLHFQAAIITLYRPFIRDLPTDITLGEQSSWLNLVTNKLRIAASDAASAINCMMAENLIGFCQTLTVLAIIPPMQVHLLESMSTSSSSRQLAKHNFALCMLALDEMRKTFVSADAAYKLFERARSLIENTSREPEENTQENGTSPIPLAAVQGVETVEWLDAFENYDIPSTEVFSYFWTPFERQSPLLEDMVGSFPRDVYDDAASSTGQGSGTRSMG